MSKLNGLLLVIFLSSFLGLCRAGHKVWAIYQCKQIRQENAQFFGPDELFDSLTCR